MLRPLAKGAAVAGTAATGLALSDRDRRDAVTNVASGAVRFGRAFAYGTLVSLDFKYRCCSADEIIADPVRPPNEYPWPDRHAHSPDRKGLRNLEPGSDEYEDTRKRVNQRSAERLLYVCSKHGGVYTKFGQHISSMNHILPKEYTETLKVLQDRNPSVGLDEVARTIRKELGAEISELFQEFDEEAIAAASLAQGDAKAFPRRVYSEQQRAWIRLRNLLQTAADAPFEVHRARTICGKEVAVKLQYPGLQHQVEKDLRGMRFLASLVGRVFPGYQYTWLFPDFEETIALELDFVQEGTNAERVARMFRSAHDVFVPAIHWEYSSRRVLTMDFVRGVKISNREGIAARGMDPKAVAETVTHTFADMMYCHGFVHCDPHPGNLMAREDPFFALGAGRDGATSDGVPRRPAKGRVPHQVVLLDHGMYRRLDPSFRHTYCRLWKSFITRNEALGRQCAVELGVAPDLFDALSLILTWRPSSTTARVGQRISEEERQALKVKYKDILTPDSLNAFLEKLPRDMLFVMRTSDLVRSLNKELGGTTRQRLIKLAEGASRGLHIPNSDDHGGSSSAPLPSLSTITPEQADRFVGSSEALAEEEAFREYLDREGVRHPSRLSLVSPRAGVNRLVASERGMVPSRRSWLEWCHLRLRLWAMDTLFRLLWWWQRRTPFTDRDIG